MKIIQVRLFLLNKARLQKIQNSIIDVSYHFIDNLQRKSVINVIKVNTEEEIADLLINSLGRTKFEMLKTV